MNFKFKKSENLTFWFYDVGFRKEFKLTYKLPMWCEVKEWWKRIRKKK